MASNQNLDGNIRIVKDDGTPTEFFMRLLQTRGKNQDVTAASVANLVPNTRRVNTTTPLSGGGSLTADLTLTHVSSGVTPGTYTNATVVVDAKGHVTSASSGAGGSGSVLGPSWTALTFGSSSTIFGTAGRFASVETFTLASGQVLQVEALIYNDRGTGNGSALGIYKPSSGEGFYNRNLDDGDIRMYKYVSSTETAITALGANNTNDFSAIMEWSAQLSIDSTTNALFCGTIDGVRLLTSQSHGIATVNLTGTVSPWIFSTDMTKTIARARVLG